MPLYFALMALPSANSNHTLDDPAWAQVLSGEDPPSHSLSREEVSLIAGGLTRLIQIPSVAPEHQIVCLARAVRAIDHEITAFLPPEVVVHVHTQEIGIAEDVGKRVSARVRAMLAERVHFPHMSDREEKIVRDETLRIFDRALRKGRCILHSQLF